MDQSSFGILGYNKLRKHNLVSVACMSKHMSEYRVCLFQENAHKFHMSAIYWQQIKEMYQMAAIWKL